MWKKECKVLNILSGTYKTYKEMLAEKCPPFSVISLYLYPLLSEKEGTLFFFWGHHSSISICDWLKRIRGITGSCKWKSRGKTDFSSSAVPEKSNSASLLCPCWYQIQLKVRAPQDHKMAAAVSGPHALLFTFKKRMSVASRTSLKRAKKLLFQKPEENPFWISLV